MKFNLTPVIDIVFLLIIFFMLVCQFIVAENFEVAVPDDISSARPAETSADQITTVTVMSKDRGSIAYAVGADQIHASEAGDIAGAIATEIDKQLQSLPVNRRVVCLRVDKDVCFSDSQHALAGISQSTATDMKLAVVKQRSVN